MGNSRCVQVALDILIGYGIDVVVTKRATPTHSCAV